MARSVFHGAMVLGWVGSGASGCVSSPPALPEVPGATTAGEEASTITSEGARKGEEGETTASEGTTEAEGLTSEGETTGPAVVCGNGAVEPGEDCCGGGLGRRLRKRLSTSFRISNLADTNTSSVGFRCAR